MDGSVFPQIAVLLLIANAVYASFAHRKGKLTIYVDWTDAAITAASPLAALLVYYLLAGFLGLSQPASEKISIGVFCALTYFGLRLSWRANGSVFAFISATLARYTMLVLIYFLVVAIASTGKRRKGERESTAGKRNAALIAATVASYAAWSAWVSRSSRFSPIGNWIEGNSHLLADEQVSPDGSLAQAE